MIKRLDRDLDSIDLGLSNRFEISVMIESKRFKYYPAKQKIEARLLKQIMRLSLILN